MSFRQLWEGTNNDTFFSRLDGRTKLCVLFLFALIMVIVDNPRTLFILFSISIALHIAAGTPVYKWRCLRYLFYLGCGDLLPARHCSLHKIHVLPFLC